MTDSIIVDAAFDCPKCSEPHIDLGEWIERAHRTHQCQNCGYEWSVTLRGTERSGKEFCFNAHCEELRKQMEPELIDVLCQTQVSIVTNLRIYSQRYDGHFETLMAAYDAIEKAKLELLERQRPPQLGAAQVRGL